MLKISGFARGEALLAANKDNNPSPCCVVLEDDACLCDRFSERLDALLEELPRDFHFCSIGYSRPQRAPIVEYSSQLGIPSCLWYLTGYIISLEGANYLLESLPVVGPGMTQTEWLYYL
jgi:GR25 family glycosyltransferase involved in LPS biosynthesis